MRVRTSAREQRCARRRRNDVRGHRTRQGRSGRVSNQHPEGAQGEDLPRKSRQAGLHREGERQVEAAWNPDHQGQNHPSRSQARRRADIRGGLPRLLVRLQARSERATGGRANRQAGEGRRDADLRRRPVELLRHDTARQALSRPTCRATSTRYRTTSSFSHCASASRTEACWRSCASG